MLYISVFAAPSVLQVVYLYGQVKVNRTGFPAFPAGDPGTSGGGGGDVCV